jgi:hypothetical protein
MLLTVSGICFFVFPDISSKYASFAIFRFIPSWIWGSLYLSIAIVGVRAIYSHKISMWKAYAMAAIAAFTFNSIAFLIAWVSFGGSPTTFGYHAVLAYAAFRDYLRPSYRLLISEVAAQRVHLG